MDNLAAKTCFACQGGIPPMTEATIAVFKSKLDAEAPGWEVIEYHHLKKRLPFADFQSALEFVNLVGALAEGQGHHPNISFSWGFVEITIWTHKINGLHESDFILAAKINSLH